jgi:hypothetical protein
VETQSPKGDLYAQVKKRVWTSRKLPVATGQQRVGSGHLNVPLPSDENIRTSTNFARALGLEKRIGAGDRELLRKLFCYPLRLAQE